MGDEKKRLIERLQGKRAVIGVFGLGYVGLPLAIRYAEMGYRVIGIDVDSAKVEQLNQGASYIERIPAKQIRKLLDAGFQASSRFARVEEMDALIFCVPTPLDKHRQPDLGFVIRTLESSLPWVKKGQIVSLESTTWPGTTEEELLPRLASTGLVVGKDVFLAYSPEREDPGNPDFSTHSIPKIVSGSTPACLDVAKALYEPAIDRVVPLSSTRAAEMTKLLENIHRAVNIGLVNEMKMVADRMGVDIHEVIRAAATKPFGFTPYYPGPGLGGHCIPIDPFYLTWKAREYDVHTRFIELAGEVNSNMPRWVIAKLMDALNERGKPLCGASVLVLGIAYKKDVDDMRESPSVVLMELLQEKGASVEYSDSHVPVFPKMRDHYFELSSVKLSPERVSAFDAVLLATDHSDVDYEMVKHNAQLIVDTRGVYLEPESNVVVA